MRPGQYVTDHLTAEPAAEQVRHAHHGQDQGVAVPAFFVAHQTAQMLVQVQQQVQVQMQ